MGCQKYMKKWKLEMGVWHTNKQDRCYFQGKKTWKQRVRTHNISTVQIRRCTLISENWITWYLIMLSTWVSHMDNLIIWRSLLSKWIRARWVHQIGIRYILWDLRILLLSLLELLIYLHSWLEDILK